MGEIVVKPIGLVHNRDEEEFVKDSLGGVEGTIEIFDDFKEGLDKIEGFSHIIIVSYLDKVGNEEQRVLKVRFRRLIRFGIKFEDLPEVGVFCSDSPHRPVPIAITIVKLLKRESRFLHVDGLDLFNKTPILDIKPYTPDRIERNVELPEWYKELESKVSQISGLKNPSL
ncbi:MAG: tRNA (N6-threonylcarbamoyladenosine(37)-N6)-methyltransferase TrmO [Candidatus Methylarchaceae archaeon HK02M2]|nr:tRNA (N6-threonylcarbamoyladenosine(37)-N6)-methyltransferase TrmO [Candidatus Methylarchaceae archaeon HK02M2]